MHLLHYNVVDIHAKPVQTETQIVANLTCRHVVGGAGKTLPRKNLLTVTMLG